MAGSHAEVAVQSKCRLAAEGQGAATAALADDGDELLVQVQVVIEHDAGALGPADACVDE
jgi:hypothetical protein